ncbi:unnamed protein product, partial [Chrysoparadoxa australica]
EEETAPQPTDPLPQLPQDMLDPAYFTHLARAYVPQANLQFVHLLPTAVLLEEGALPLFANVEEKLERIETLRPGDRVGLISYRPQKEAEAFKRRRRKRSHESESHADAAGLLSARDRSKAKRVSKEAATGTGTSKYKEKAAGKARGKASARSTEESAPAASASELKRKSKEEKQDEEDMQFQFGLIKKWLDLNQDITHVWTRLSCLPNLEELLEGQGQEKSLDHLHMMANTSTAILTGSKFLLVPRLIHTNGQRYSDFFDFCYDMWCRVEAMGGLLGQASITIALACAKHSYLADLPKGHRNLKELVEAALLESFPKLPSVSAPRKATKSNWLKCQNPWYLVEVVKADIADWTKAEKRGKDMLGIMGKIREGRLPTEWGLESNKKHGRGKTSVLQTSLRACMALGDNNQGGGAAETAFALSIMLQLSAFREGAMGAAKHDVEIEELIAITYDGTNNHLNLNKMGLAPIDLQAILKMMATRGTNVKSISLQENHTEGTGLQSFMQSNQSLRELSLVGEPLHAPSEISKPLRDGCRLIKLEMSANGLGDVGAILLAEAMQSHPTVEWVSIENNNIGDTGALSWGKALSTNAALCSLSLSNNMIADDGGAGIAGGLKANRTLHYLALETNQLGSSAGVAFGELLAINTALQTLDLGGNTNKLGPAGGVAIGKGLAASTLKSLLLFGDQIGNEGGCALAASLRTNNALTALNLASDHDAINLGEPAGCALGEALAFNQTLQTLNINGNAMGCKACNAIAESLSINSALTHLSMRSCSIGVAGAKSIAHALRANRTLTFLDLGGDVNSTLNQVEEEGGTAIFKALEENSTLTSLDMCKNYIGQGAASSIQAMLMVNRTLRMLNLRGCEIGEDGGIAIGEALKPGMNDVCKTIQVESETFHHIEKVNRCTLHARAPAMDPAVLPPSSPRSPSSDDLSLELLDHHWVLSCTTMPPSHSFI